MRNNNGLILGFSYILAFLISCFLVDGIEENRILSSSVVLLAFPMFFGVYNLIVTLGQCDKEKIKNDACIESENAMKVLFSILLIAPMVCKVFFILPSCIAMIFLLLLGAVNLAVLYVIYLYVSHQGINPIEVIEDNPQSVEPQAGGSVREMVFEFEKDFEK